MMDIDTCHTGDCRDVMRCMIADGLRVQTIVTSPPYSLVTHCQKSRIGE